MSLYELAILGGPSEDERRILTAKLSELTDELGLKMGSDVLVHDASSVTDRDKHNASAAVYFGEKTHPEENTTLGLVRDSIPVIPTISEEEDFGRLVPPSLQFANGLKRRKDDCEMDELATALLECVGLLRRQRRVFVSYRRVESRAAALQLHDLLNSRGFDVFLDTHDIRPGDPFQETLWHRLVDSDVMVMLDTPGYFNSRWTRQELGRARAKEIMVLRVIWPEHLPSKLTEMAETTYLNAKELEGPDGPILQPVAERIVLQVERLRSRSIASRYMSITGKFRADVERIGASIEGVGAHRAISVRLSQDTQLWAYPVVGIPTAETLNDVADKAKQAGQPGLPILIYDHVGIGEAWSAHLKWLDGQISAVRAIKVSEAGWELAGWDN